MKIDINKKVVATLLAGSMAFTLSGCAKKSTEYVDPSDTLTVEYAYDYDEPYYEEEPIYNNYPDESKDLRTNEEQVNNEQINNNVINNEQVNNEQINDNVINNDQAKSNNYINLVITNIPENARISLGENINTELNTFEKTGENTYRIPSNNFKISFEVNGNTYTYPIIANNDSTVFTSLNTNDNIQFNIEINENLSVEKLKNRLADSNINLVNLYNNGYNQDIVQKHNVTFNGQNLAYERKAIYLNNLLLNEYKFDNGNVSYFSPLRLGNGENNIEIKNNDTIKLSYTESFINDYTVISNMENNVNYFFNKVNNTTETNYFNNGDVDIAHFVGENTEITEYLEKFYYKDFTSERYSYKVNGDALLEFGQVNYDYEYFLTDPNNLVNVNTIIFDNNRENTNDNTNNNVSGNDDYVHYYSDDYKTPTGGDYDHYYSDDYKTPTGGDYDHYYVDDYKTPTDDDYVHYYSDDDHYYDNDEYSYDYDEDSYDYEEEYEPEIYEYEEEYQYTR